MTVAQKANQLRFKKVQAEAKKLKAKNKKLTHIQAVKQAWAIILHKSTSKKVSGYEKTEKKGSTTKVIYTKKAIKNKGKKAKLSPFEQAEKLYPGDPRNRFLSKSISGMKKKAAKKSPVTKHKDTKSHNVNIKVMSGFSKTKFYL